MNRICLALEQAGIDVSRRTVYRVMKENGRLHKRRFRTGSPRQRQRHRSRRTFELSKSEWQKLLTEFIQEQFILDGMCADVAIHDPYPTGHNPHAHIMVTVRPLDEQDKWQYKTEKE